MLWNSLTLLPRKDEFEDRDSLVNLLLITKNKVENKLDKDKKIKTIIDLFIKQLKEDKFSIDDYLNIRNEMIKTDEDRLDRIIDTYIYILDKEKVAIEKQTNYFINKNNLNVLQNRCVLIRYNHTKPIIYKNYIKNMEYIEIFNFLRFVDGKYLSFINKVINLYSFNKNDFNKINEMYEDIINLFETELGYLKEDELTINLFLSYKEDLLKRIRINSSEIIRRDESKKYDEQIEYFATKSKSVTLSRAKQKLKYGYTTRNYLGD